MKLKTFKRSHRHGQFLILLSIMLLLTSCQSLKKDVTMPADDATPGVWVGKRGETPTQVWQKRDWILCDRNIYYCHPLE